MVKQVKGIDKFARKWGAKSIVHDSRIRTMRIVGHTDEEIVRQMATGQKKTVGKQVIDTD